MRAEERGAPSASLLEAAALLPGTPGPAVSCRWGQRHRVAPALPSFPHKAPTARSRALLQGSELRQRLPPSCSGPGFCFFACLIFSTPSRRSSSPPPSPRCPPPLPSPPHSFPLFCSFVSFHPLPPACREQPPDGTEQWDAHAGGQPAEEPGGARLAAGRLGGSVQVHNHVLRAGGRGAEQAGRAALPGRGSDCGPFLHRWDGATAWSPASLRPSSAPGGTVPWTPGSPLVALRRSLCLCFVPSLLLGPAALWGGRGSARPPAALRPLPGCCPLFLWAGGDGLVVPRCRGGPASGWGLRLQAAIAVLRDLRGCGSLWGLSPSARPCWGSGMAVKLLGDWLGVVGRLGAKQHKSSRLPSQPGEPGPPRRGAATCSCCCGARDEALWDAPPHPTARPHADVCLPAGDELHQRRAEHGRPDGGALERAHHSPHRGGGDRRYKVRTPPAPHCTPLAAPPPP